MPLQLSRFITSQEKFLIVIETYTLSEIELYKYCQERGLYVEKVKIWQSNCLRANSIKDCSKKIKYERQKDKKRIKVLEMELTRTETVLNEITALLMLSPTFAQK